MGNTENTIGRKIVKEGRKVGKLDHPALGDLTLLQVSSSMYALKCLPLSPLPQPTSTLQNLSLYQQLRSQYVCRPIDYFVDSSSTFCGRGQLLSVIFKFDEQSKTVNYQRMEPYTEEEVLQAISNVLEAMREIKDVGLNFRRLQSNNLVQEAGQFRLCIVRELLEPDLEGPLLPLQSEAQELNQEQQKVRDLGMIALEMCSHGRTIPADLNKAVMGLNYSRQLKMLLKQMICPEVKPIPGFQELSVYLIAARYKRKSYQASPIKNRSPVKTSPKITNNSKVSQTSYKSNNPTIKSQLSPRNPPKPQSPQPRLHALRKQREQYLLSEVYTPKH